MPTLRKRVQACRQSAALSVAKRQRIRLEQLKLESEGGGSASRSETEQESEVEISDAEDGVLKLAQPAEWWKEVQWTAYSPKDYTKMKSDWNG